MGEFWSYGLDMSNSVTEMTSSAHVYGKRIVGAEAFTALDIEKWLGHPGNIKPLGDWAFCEGVNRFVFHRYAMQPRLTRRPFMLAGPWALHYERTQTWWEQSAAWHLYVARCQQLLRQGLFVADICFVEPEGAPRSFSPPIARTGNPPDRPGYNFDLSPPEAVLTRMSVRDGRVVLPDGMSYRLLVLPDSQTMTPALLGKIAELVQAMDRVAREIVEAHTQCESLREQIPVAQSGIRLAADSYQRNLQRIRGGQGLPLEVLQSLQALDQSRREYLRAVGDYDEWQFRLYHALGCPIPQEASLAQ